MAHDEKISEPTGNDVHHEPPASASASAQVPDVATLRAMMHERQYAAGKALEQQLEADVLHAREVQEELLFEMIEANKDTPFGRDHGFADIKTVEDFKRTVPFTNYDDYAGYIYEVMEHGTRGVVTTEEIVHFNETSGTMGNPKGIPYTKRMAEILMGYSGAYTYYRSLRGRGRGPGRWSYAHAYRKPLQHAEERHFVRVAVVQGHCRRPPVSCGDYYQPRRGRVHQARHRHALSACALRHRRARHPRHIVGVHHRRARPYALHRGQLGAARARHRAGSHRRVHPDAGRRACRFGSAHRAQPRARCRVARHLRARL